MLFNLNLDSDPGLKAPGFQSLIVKRIDIAFNLKPGFLSLRLYLHQGLLTVAKEGKKNVFSGRILEIEGLEHLKCEQAFELSDASAERSAAGCTIKLDKEPIAEYLRSNIVMLKWMIQSGYGDRRTVVKAVQARPWLESTTPPPGFKL